MYLSFKPHISSLSLIDGSKEGKQYSCRFLFKPHSKPLLLDSLTSGVDYIKESDYIRESDYISPCLHQRERLHEPHQLLDGRSLQQYRPALNRFWFPISGSKRHG
jgi:hypothetical protein